MILEGFSNLYLSVIASPHGCPGSFCGLISARLALLLLTRASREKLDSGTAFPSIISDSLFICFLGFTFLIQLSPALQMFFPQLLTPGCRAGSIHLWLSWRSTGGATPATVPSSPARTGAQLVPLAGGALPLSSHH